MGITGYAEYTHPGGRPQNEDAVLSAKRNRSFFSPEKLLFLVADGLGGHGGGSIASSSAVKAAAEQWDGSISEQEWLRLMQKANEAVLAQQSATCQMKSTMVGLMLQGKRAVWAHIGDSRLYHFQNGKLVFQTQDHSVPQLAVMMGDIKPEDIRFHPSRSQVLRALGEESILPQVQLETLTAGRHAFLLCTDGFWEYVLESEMEATLQSSPDPQQWLSAMRTIADSRAPQKRDNNTASAVFYTL